MEDGWWDKCIQFAFLHFSPVRGEGKGGEGDAELYQYLEMRISI